VTAAASSSAAKEDLVGLVLVARGLVPLAVREAP
jgi:hypothetical protein